MQAIAPVLVLFSVLFPSKMFYAPTQPILVQVKDATDVTLVLTDFTGKPIEPQGPMDYGGERVVDVSQTWPQLKVSGTYLLMAVQKGKSPSEFSGTPLVIQVRGDNRREAVPGPMIIKVEPLRYGLLSTEKGDATMVFYYDVAPITVGSFQRLADGGFFDGLTFHRIIEGFVVQGGDPRGDGTGGPGYQVPAEFSNREHREGALSMARQGDPSEVQGAMPRPEFANSAGSQFFICLNYQRTKQLDGRYTVFGLVTDGMNAIHELAKVPTEKETNRPLEPQVIKSVKVLPVTSQNNPYAKFLNLSTVPLSAPGAGS